MFIVNGYRPTFPFVFQRGGGRLSVTSRLMCARRPAEKQNGNNKVAALGYKHGTPSGVWSWSRNSNAAPSPETARDLLTRAAIAEAVAFRGPPGFSLSQTGCSEPATTPGAEAGRLEGTCGRASSAIIFLNEDGHKA